MRLTASRIALARHCAWWARPEVTVPEQDASSAADVGTALHAVAEQEAEDVDEQAVDESFRALAWLQAADTGPAAEFSPADAGIDLRRPADQAALEQLVSAWRAWWSTFAQGLSGIATEVPFALDVLSGSARELPRAGQRDYSAATDSEVPGTADLIGVRAGELVVVDYKTGRGPHRYRDHEEQLRFLGACAALEHRVSVVRVIVAHVTPDGVFIDDRVLDSLDIAVVVHELRELVAIAVSADARPGLHCEDDWCPAKAVCPVTRALLIEAKMPLDERRRLPLVGPPKTEEETYARLIAIPLLEALLEDWKKTAKAFADTTPVHAPDGRTYRPRPTRRESPRLDVGGAEEKLVEVLGADVAGAAIKVSRKTSWTSIKDALRKSRADGRAVNLTDVEEHARSALREIGALKISEFTSYEWRQET